MPIYIHDGTPDGILAALGRALDEDRESAEFAFSGAWQGSLFEDAVAVKTDPAAAEALSDRAAFEISKHAARNVLMCIFSEEKGIEGPLYRFLRLGFSLKKDISGFHTNPDVDRVNRVSSAVRGEIHRLKGLLRFRELDKGVLWAPVEPDYNVIIPVSYHFRTRLAAEKWAVHDTKRNYAVCWDGESLGCVSGSELDGLLQRAGGAAPAFSERELVYQQLWKTFFKNIAVQGRKNSRLQAQNMPRRYWRHLVEKAISNYTPLG